MVLTFSYQAACFYTWFPPPQKKKNVLRDKFLQTCHFNRSKAIEVKVAFQFNGMDCRLRQQTYVSSLETFNKPQMRILVTWCHTRQIIVNLLQCCLQRDWTILRCQHCLRLQDEQHSFATTRFSLDNIVQCCWP